AGARFDVIVCNPPYIGRSEQISAEVRDWEPEEALFADENGFAFIRDLASQARGYLSERGELWLEVGYSQAKATRQVFSEAGWEHRDTRKDLLGHERVLGFRP